MTDQSIIEQVAREAYKQESMLDGMQCCPSWDELPIIERREKVAEASRVITAYQQATKPKWDDADMAKAFVAGQNYQQQFYDGSLCPCFEHWIREYSQSTLEPRPENSDD